MKKALEEAKKAFLKDEVPVGALIVREGSILSQAHNLKEHSKKASFHAEILAIQEASEKLQSWRLEGCTLYTTLEPCLMCCGAILQARIEKVVFALKDPKFGAAKSLYTCLSDERLNHQCEVREISMQEESESLLKDFFRKKRKLRN